MKLATTCLCIVCLLVFGHAHADVFTVTTNADSGPGSLRQALTDANNSTGSDKITFNIEAADVASRTITLETNLPELNGKVTIDGTTQPNGTAFGVSYARIQLVAAVPTSATCFSVLGDSCEIYGFFINNFKTGIFVEGTYVKIGAIQKGNVIYNCSSSAITLQSTNHAGIQGNLIGVDTVGLGLPGATGNGIEVVSSFLVSIGGKTLLANNVISANNRGIYIENSAFVDVNSNNIGTAPNGLTAQANQYGIYCSGINNNIEIGGDSLFEKNIISGNTFSGIYGVMSNSSIQGNVIGLNMAGAALGNGAYGIYLAFGSSDNKIGGEFLQANVIAENGSEAIAFQNGTCQRNTITRNSMFCNSKNTGTGGIKLNNANGNIPAPVLTIVTADGISGTTVPNGMVELFTSDGCLLCEGMIYLATVTANANGVFTFINSITGSITATVTDEDGNTSAFAACADTGSVACIVSGFTLAGNLCPDNVLTFSDQSVTLPGDEVTGWSWNFGDGGTAEEASPGHIYEDPGTYTVQLISSSSSGCTDTITKSITVNELPLAGFLVLPASCVNTIVHFADQSQGGGTGTISQRSWDFGDGGTSTAVNPNHVYSDPGIYEVTLTVTNNFGCTDVQATNIIIAPKPNASFTYSASSTEVSFTNTTNFNGAHSSSWDFDDGSTSTLDNPVHTYASPGTYLVCLTTYDSLCKDENIACSIVDIVTGMQETGAASSLSIYPNPAEDQVTISGNRVSIQQIRLTGITGETILTSSNLSGQSGPVVLQLPSLAAGVYLLYLETEAGVVMKKLLIDQ